MGWRVRGMMEREVQAWTSGRETQGEEDVSESGTRGRLQRKEIVMVDQRY